MKIRLLIVDDTRSWVSFHKDLIEALYGDIFEITVAYSAKDALDIARHNIEKPFLLIITDLQMEDAYGSKVAGEWLIEQIKNINQYSRTHFLIVSAMYNIEYITAKLGVSCISKLVLVHNKLLMKYTIENMMPFLNKRDVDINNLNPKM